MLNGVTSIALKEGEKKERTGATPVKDDTARIFLSARVQRTRLM